MTKTEFKYDRELKALKPEEKPYDVRDFHTRNLSVRVSPKGAKTFTFVARFPGFTNPTRVSLGDFPDLSLEAARDKAGEWRKLIKAGIDPREAIRERKEQQQRERDTTFGAVAEDYIKRRLKKQRRGDVAAYEIRKDLIPVWQKKPIAKITRADVVTVIENIIDRRRESSGAHARNVFGHVRLIFDWAIESGKYDLEVSPCDRLKPKSLIGEKKPRQRVLTDDELRAFWRATDRMSYPYGSLFRFLLLTGARQSEGREARWTEFHADLVRILRQRKDGEPIDWSKVPASAKIWTIPPERFKSDVVHRVALSVEALRILETLPIFSIGKNYLFSATLGESAVFGLSKSKSRLDARMLRALRATARKCGDDPKTVQLTPFVLHDLRRTFRTRLSSLRIQTEIAELAVGHARKGINRTYDVHEFEDELREAFEAWGNLLRSIVCPTATNVVPMHRAG